MSVGFTIMGSLPTINEIVAASKKHHMQYAKMKKDYTDLVMLHARNLPKVKKADYEITWYCQDKRKDKDGIMAGQKFIFDGLIKAGVITNDGWQQIGNVKHNFEVDKSKPRIEVIIQEIE